MDVLARAAMDMYFGQIAISRLNWEHSFDAAVPVGVCRSVSEFSAILRQSLEVPGGHGDRRRAAMAVDGRPPEATEVAISNEAERELYLLAVERHDESGKRPDHICRQAFVAVALEHGLQARGGGVVCSSRSMRSAVNKQVLPVERAPERQPSVGGGGGHGGGRCVVCGGGGGGGGRRGSWAAATGFAALTAKSRGGGASLVDVARVAVAKEKGQRDQAMFAFRREL